jgi:hypothetical protein
MNVKQLMKRELAGETESFEENLPQSTLSIKIPHDLGSNHGHRGGKPVTSGLNYGSRHCASLGSGTSPWSHILNLVTILGLSGRTSCPSRSDAEGDKNSLMSTRLETECASKPVWTLWRRQKFLSLQRIKPQSLDLGRSLVTILNNSDSLVSKLIWNRKRSEGPIREYGKRWLQNFWYDLRDIPARIIHNMLRCPDLNMWRQSHKQVHNHSR